LQYLAAEYKYCLPIDEPRALTYLEYKGVGKVFVTTVFSYSYIIIIIIISSSSIIIITGGGGGSSSNSISGGIAFA
jgi:hypothetical protein